MKKEGLGRHEVCMPALGRHFLLGDFYNYCTEHRVITGKQENAESAIRVEHKFDLEFMHSTCKEKWEIMDLNEHMQATIAAGLIDKYRGASNYLNDQHIPTQVTHTFGCRVQSRQEKINCLETYLSSYLLSNAENLNITTEATHIVTNIVYGAEFYCVLAEDMEDGQEIDDDVRFDAEKKLSKIATKIEDALNDCQNLADFKEQFDKEESKQLSRMKCRLYADLPSQAVREFGVFDVYKRCLKLIEQVKHTAAENKIAIAVLLCPRAAWPTGGCLKIQYRDVDADLIARCCHILDELDQMTIRLDTLRRAHKKANRTSLKKFGDAISKYKEMIKTSLKNGVVKARHVDSNDQEIERIVNIIENQPLFKPNRLERFINFKKAESEMIERMSGVTGIAYVNNEKQLENSLSDSFTIKYSMVLNVPPLDEKTNEILEAMNEYVQYTKLVAADNQDEDSDEEDFDEDNQPWHMIPRKRKLILEKIREFANHVEKNKHVLKETQFMIMPGDENKCSYSIYADGVLLKGNLSQLPSAPTGLKLQLISIFPKSKSAKKLTSIRLEWDYEDLGYPHHFCVEYRLKHNSENWLQQKTKENQTTLNFKLGSSMEIRVVAETCIGRSQYSDIINTDNVLDMSEVIDSDAEEEKTPTQKVENQPKLKTTNGTAEPRASNGTITPLDPPTDLEVELVTQTTAELGWSRPSNGTRNISYRVRYWKSDEDETTCQKFETASSGCRLQELEPETTYFVNVVALSNDEQSQPSKTVELTTQIKEVRFAETIVKRCKKIGNRNGMDLFGVPLVKSSGATAERFVFGRPDGKLQHRTILVMGATGSGKTTLINGLINYVFNVQWEDTFRFQLIQEQMAGRSQVDSQTSRITAYDIHHAEGFRVPYSLTIVDTPGYGDTKGLDRDQEITDMVRKFFEDKNGIQELDVVGFVAQASLPRLTPTQIYIFDSVLSIFGNDVKENINFLLTFADSQVPPVLSAIAQAGLPCQMDASTGEPLNHKFNNSGFFCSSRESATNTADKFNRFFWQMGMSNFQNFFTQLATMKTKSLSLTKQVLDERKRLESTVDGLQPLIKIGLAKMEELRKTKTMISNCQAQIDANENVEFEVEVNMPKKVENLSGYLTNCNKCYVTCHNPCAIPDDEGKMSCAAMDHTMAREIRCCRICPEKCIWNMHANQPYRWEYVAEKQATSSDAIKQKYETELKKKLTAEELVKVLEHDIDVNNKTVLQRVDIVSRCIQRLDEIALRPNPFSTPQYIDLIIDAEQQEKRVGFKERIESLKKLRQMAVITSKVKNKESLLTMDKRDDDDDQSVDEDDDQTADADDDDGASVKSLTGRLANLLSPTDQHKFQSSFFNH
ncbi:hypothetical protein GHT06_004662 [Daphnia sinensis]|uniref:Fibronectin type-III domain-containing protein n=1 Tax=Daphnia sinensis TaxID=1820382 RepID=A0AAD5KGL5_9CRUS|nr:hypothetical protein GHT06_004662 [Daphnia sinensis]